MFAARRLASRTMLVAIQRRSAQTVPRLGTNEEMTKEALEQLRARLAYQKQLKANSGEMSHDEEVNEMWKWIKISFFVALPICILSSIKDILFPDHAHRHEGPLPDYMNIQSKPFPWECEDCALFDQPCWDKCKAEKKLA